MKINPASLSQHLQNKLLPIYAVFYQETFQGEEIIHEIIKKAKSEDYIEREKHILNSKSDWSFLKNTNENLDLFSKKKVIEVKLIGSGPGVKGAKVIQESLTELTDNSLYIFALEGLDKKTQNSAWVKNIESKGGVIVENAIPLSKLPQWISERCKKQSISISLDACKLLAENTQGNLMAAVNEINKIPLIYPNQEISIGKMQKCISNSSKYGVFDLTNFFQKGDKKGLIKTLEILKSEGTPETLILWALTREVQNLYRMKIIGRSAVWGPRYYIDLVENRSKQTELEEIKKSLDLVAKVDQSIKGYSKENPWNCIRELSLAL
tara:strand:- start:18019 stop:18987 length:969 start_codon:yes stop_codon:yes gene_type:complete